MRPETIEKYISIYKNGLLEDIIPFWLRHSVDHEYGGFMFALDRDGTVIDTDKSVWLHGRFVWTLATLYNEVEQNPLWLELAEHGAKFLTDHCIDNDGRMFFLMDRQGNPLRKRRYVFSESFGAIGFAALYKAGGNKKYRELAVSMFDIYRIYGNTPGLITPKFTEHRKMKGLGHPMIGMATAQELRKNLGDDTFTKYIDEWIDEIREDFMNRDFRAVMETVGPNGEFLEHFDGRTLNPGHGIEGAWFILEEARIRNNDPKLIETGVTMLDWMWEIGRDKEYGGLLYFRDVKGLPVQEYWHDMKFWWPHNEAVIATLMAFELTGDEKCAKWHEMVHEWAFGHFPDKEYGEWYGYLHRDGRLSVPLKGNHWKGPFHVPRMYLTAWKTLERIRDMNKGV